MNEKKISNFSVRYCNWHCWNSYQNRNAIRKSSETKTRSDTGFVLRAKISVSGALDYSAISRLLLCLLWNEKKTSKMVFVPVATEKHHKKVIVRDQIIKNGSFFCVILFWCFKQWNFNQLKTNNWTDLLFLNPNLEFKFSKITQEFPIQYWWMIILI